MPKGQELSKATVWRICGRGLVGNREYALQGLYRDYMPLFPTTKRFAAGVDDARAPVSPEPLVLTAN